MPKNETFNKEEVLDATLRLFWSKGYYATSIQDLVEATGLNRSSIYNSFGDKHSLFKASLVRYRQQQRQSTNNWLLNSDSPKQAIINLFKGIAHEIVEVPENKGCFFSNSTTEFGNRESDLFDILLNNQIDMESMLSDLISKGQASGEINKGIDPDTSAGYLFSSLQGLRVTGILKRDKTYICGIVDQILKIL